MLHSTSQMINQNDFPLLKDSKRTWEETGETTAHSTHHPITHQKHQNNNQINNNKSQQQTLRLTVPFNQIATNPKTQFLIKKYSCQIELSTSKKTGDLTILLQGLKTQVNSCKLELLNLICVNIELIIPIDILLIPHILGLFFNNKRFWR